MSRPRTALVGALAALATALAACAGASPSPAGPAAIDITLQEWAVVPSVTSTAAGDVTFTIINNGPNDVHEFVILKTDLAPGDLPTDDRGVVDEAGGPMEVIDEVEDVAVGATETLSVSLASGSYVLLCNIYDESEGEAHYAEGMRIGFTVE
ncbi:MAG TPA: hypothetical protein VK838_00840 [Candidatus Limnocylindrales bacterium]|nr:hypothetical protein [Candidatus Limnocylindrales bacterium]